MTDTQTALSEAGTLESPAALPRPQAAGASGRWRRRFYHLTIRLITAVHELALGLARRLGPRPRPARKGGGLNILVTGRFDSNNWILSHLGPLSASQGCRRLWMVSTNPIPPLAKVTGIYPPRWLRRLVGKTPARLATFWWAAFRLRPDIVGGFHMLVNGMVAALVGKCVGARTMYFCVGGPAEVLEGGVRGEGNYFSRMETPDLVVERRLIHAVQACDLVITMGTRAVKFFQGKGVRTDFHVVSGGIESARFHTGDQPPSIDLILTGRLVPIKRIDVFLEAVALVRGRRPDVSAVIVGSGDLKDPLRQRAGELGISECVRFVGHQENVDDWLRKSRIFLLTSDSEGLSLSMMEAMMCGLPAVVSDVGDLGDLVESGVNGFLVPPRRPEMFAQRILEILCDPDRLAAMSRSARRSALRYEVARTVELWNGILLGNRKAREE